MNENITFETMNLAEPVMEAVRTMGFTTPTPVQQRVIPVACEGKDIMASAQTGTGKTAAFLLPIFDSLIREWGDKRPGKKRKHPEVVVLAPTRELAVQISECAQAIAEHAGFRVLTVIGGVKYDKQLKGLEAGCDILIATPGRLGDLMNRKAVRLDKARYLVIDEVDRMVDMGFWPSVSAICRQVTGARQTMLLSATFTATLEAKAKFLVNDPVRIEISPQGSTADTVREFVCPVSASQKQALLSALLDEQGTERVLVFTSTKTEADSCARILQSKGVKADSIHADKPQKKRERLLADFRNSKLDVLVATDVLARGIDITDVSYVVNCSVPAQAEDYTHRIGRTGRAGEAGRSYTFMSPGELLGLREVEYASGHLLEHHDVAGFEYDDGRLIPDPKRPKKRGAARPGMRRFGRRR